VLQGVSLATITHSPSELHLWHVGQAEQQVDLDTQFEPQRLKPARHWVVEQLSVTQAKLPAQVELPS
jgi:hypothetical protein